MTAKSDKIGVRVSLLKTRPRIIFLTNELLSRGTLPVPHLDDIFNGRFSLNKHIFSLRLDGIIAFIGSTYKKQNRTPY